MRLVRAAAKPLVRWLAEKRVYWPFLQAVEHGINEIRAPGVVPRDDAPIVLALTPARFRGDLEALVATGKLRILAIKKSTQDLINNLYYDNWPIDYEKLNHPANDPVLAERQQRYRGFLEHFLNTLFTRLRVDAVLSATYNYKQDQDIAFVSERIGRPWIVLQRENLVTTAKQRDIIVRRCATMGRFFGSLIVLHNETVRRTMIECGFASDQQAQTLGCVRMDGFLRRLPLPPPRTRRRRVTLFSFVHGVGMIGVLNAFSPRRDIGFIRLFEDSHAEIFRLARERPDVDFVIKTKWSGGAWFDEIDKAYRLAGIAPGTLSNVTVTAEGDPQDLILGSNVVCGFGSTTLLEAAAAGRPVVVPLFHEATDPYYREFVLLRDELDRLFQVARSPEAFRRLILDGLDRPTPVDDATMAARWDAFERYVSRRTADSVDRYIDAVLEVLGRPKATEKAATALPQVSAA